MNQHSNETQTQPSRGVVLLVSAVVVALVAVAVAVGIGGGQSAAAPESAAVTQQAGMTGLVDMDQTAQGADGAMSVTDAPSTDGVSTGAGPSADTTDGSGEGESPSGTDAPSPDEGGDESQKNGSPDVDNTGSPAVQGIGQAVESNGDGSGTATGDLAVTIPSGGDLILNDADLDVQLTSSGEFAGIQSGVAVLELPLVGPLEGAFIDRMLPGRVGTARGDDLRHLGAHLRDDHQYLYFDMGSQQFDLFLDLDSQFAGAEGLPQRISTPGSGGTIFVMDLEGDYFYLSFPCASAIPAGGDSKARPTQRQAANNVDNASEIPGVSLDLSTFDPGGCGMGWSAGGNIPFTPLHAGQLSVPADFSAHIVIDGTVPVHKSASLDGEVFFRFDDDAATVWANAELDLGVSMLKGAAEVTVPVAQATVGLSMGSNHFDLWVSGTAGSSAAEGSPVSFLADIAPVQGQVDLDGELHFLNGEIQNTSYLQIQGELAILGGNAVAAAAGANVGNSLTAEAFGRIDASGIEITGSLNSSPMGDFALNGEAQLAFKVPFDDPSNGYFQLDGSISIGGVNLDGDAMVRIDRNGVLARGHVELPGAAKVAVEGWLGANGFQLTGEAEVTLPIGDLDKVAANLVDQASNAEEIRRINIAIDNRIDEIAASNPAKGAELRTTMADLRQAFEDVAVANDNIAINNAKIADVQRRIDADIAWHWALNDFDRFWDKGPHGIRLTALYAEQGVFETANIANYAYRDTANAILSTATQIAIGVVGWDAELNALVTMQAEAYWGTLTGAVVATILNGADAILDAFGIDGSAVGTVTFTVGTEGLAATAALSWCRDGNCETLAGVDVELSPNVRVCGVIMGIETCVTL